MLGTHILYGIIFALFLFGVYISGSLPDSCGRRYLSKNKMIFFLTCVLTVFAAGRMVDVTGLGGTDAWTYVRDFYSFSNPLSAYIVLSRILLLKSREPGYYLVAWVIRQITTNYKVYFLVVYAIISYGISRFAVFFTRGKKEFLCSGILVCAYLHSFNVMRNWVAIAFLMLAYVAGAQNKKRRSVILYVIAVCFHYSVAVFIASLIACRLVSRFEWTRFRLTVCCIAGCVIVVLASGVIRMLLTGTKYASYANLRSSMLGYAPVVFITILSIYHYPILLRGNPGNKALVLMNVVNTCLIYVFVYVGGYRINDAFIITRFLLLVEVVRAYFSRNVRVPHRQLYQLLMYLFLVMYAVQQYLNICETSGILPYIWGY